MECNVIRQIGKFSEIRSVSRNVSTRLAMFFMLFAIGLLAASCGYFPEASFSLSSESRVPKWFHLKPDQARESVSISVDYYVSSSGRRAEFMLRDRNGRVVSRATGTMVGLQPHRLSRAGAHPKSPYVYEIVIVGEISEVIEHRDMEPVFYINDDPRVRAELEEELRRGYSSERREKATGSN